MYHVHGKADIENDVEGVLLLLLQSFEKNTPDQVCVLHGKKPIKYWEN